MSTRVDSAAKTQPTEGRYLAHPGTCATCNKSPDNTEEIFANPIIELEYYGYLYFCQACCTELGSFVNMVPARTYEAQITLARDLAEKNIHLGNQIEYLKGLLNARVDSVGRGEPVSDDDVSVSLLETEPEPDDINSIIDSLEPDID